MKGGGGLSRRLPMTGTRRDTGLSARVRVLVRQRDGYACAGCGTSIIGRPHSIYPRRTGGMRATSWPGAYLASNLVVLCGAATSPGGCSLACEQRDPLMHARGLWLWSTEDPAAVPVLRHGSTGPEWLLPDGAIAYEEPTGRGQPRQGRPEADPKQRTSRALGRRK
jgi:hypothetical protein